MESDPVKLLEKARDYAESNLFECCKDYDVMMKTCKRPPNGAFSHLINLCTFAESSRQALAISIMQDRAFNQVIKNG